MRKSSQKGNSVPRMLYTTVARPHTLFALVDQTHNLVVSIVDAIHILEACHIVSYLDRMPFGLDMTQISSSGINRIPTRCLMTLWNSASKWRDS